MDINEEKIIEEIRKSMCECAKADAKEQPKTCGKTPMERRWNMEEKDKPVEA